MAARPFSSRTAATLVALTLAWPTVARAEEVPAERQALILTRALSYDNALRERAGDTVVIAILLKPDDDDSRTAAQTVSRAWKALEATRVQELPLRTLTFAYNSKAELAKTIDARGVDVLYICPALEAELGAIKEVSRQKKVLTIGTSEQQLQAGVSLGVFQIDGKATIEVNLPASREEGAAFASELLRLAKVIR